MDIAIIRVKKGPNSTLSRILLDGAQFCYNLEDVDRGLRQDMALKEILARKVKGSTAIPEGRYQVIITWSPRFKRLLPILLNVPGYEGIRFHPGNTYKDTDGCQLPGDGYVEAGKDWMVTNSRAAFDRLFSKIQAAIGASQKVWCTITNEY